MYCLNCKQGQLHDIGSYTFYCSTCKSVWPGELLEPEWEYTVEQEPELAQEVPQRSQKRCYNCNARVYVTSDGMFVCQDGCQRSGRQSMLTEILLPF